MFIYKTTVKMHDTYAAGILFFGNQFKMIHDAYESLLESTGFSFSVLLRKHSFFVPIVHAQADYKKPLFVGDRLTIKIRLEKIGQTSFIFLYEIFDERKVLVGTAKTVHVTIDKKTRKKIPLPKKFKSALQKLP